MEAIFKREVIVSKAGCRVFGIFIFVLLTALGAFLRVPLPFTPVPVTLQTFFVLLSGMMLGRSYGALAQLGYIFLGILGLPVFSAAGGGILYLAGPTGGYIFGFFLAAFAAGQFIRYAKNNFFFILALAYGADLIILFCGSLWLKVLLRVSLADSLFLGFFPFLAGDFLKALAAAALFKKLKSRIEEVF